MQFKNYKLDLFQEHAIHAVEQNQSVLVSAPTGSGKTLIADYIIDRDIKENKRVIYTAPIKALSNQKYRDFIEVYGEDAIGLITGDLVINSQAQVLIMTTEVYRNMAIIKDKTLDTVSYCIMDEIHYINDEERGYIWEESIIFSPEHIRFLFLSATIPNAAEFADWVGHVKHHKVDVIRHHKRPVPLDIKFYDSELGITTIEKIKEKKELDSYPKYRSPYEKQNKRGKLEIPEYTDLIKELYHEKKLPCIYFVFSRIKTEQYAAKLEKKAQLLSREEQQQMHDEVAKAFNSINAEVRTLKSTILLRNCLAKGIAFHHAGLLPDTKHIIEQLFGKGLVKVLFATETFAVGINMPAKTVCFDSLRKYTGVGFRYLTSKEYFQMAGRAGRRGIDTVGLAIALVARTQSDIKKITHLTKGDTMPIRSQFRLSYNTVLNMVNLHSRKEIEEILQMNFFTYQQRGAVTDEDPLQSIKSRYDNLVHTLEKLGYIEEHKLTKIGHFTTKIFSNEIEVSQLFAGDTNFHLDEYLMLLSLAALVYEEKRDITFYQIYPSKKVSQFIHQIRSHPILKQGEWHKNIEKMTGVIQLCYEQKKFITVLKNTNMLEGDLIRLLMQVLDKLEQIDRGHDDYERIATVRNAKQLIRSCLEGIHVF